MQSFCNINNNFHLTSIGIHAMIRFAGFLFVFYISFVSIFISFVSIFLSSFLLVSFGESFGESLGETRPSGIVVIITNEILG